MGSNGQNLPKSSSPHGDIDVRSTWSKTEPNYYAKSMDTKMKNNKGAWKNWKWLRKNWNKKKQECKQAQVCKWNKNNQFNRSHFP